MTGFCEWDKGGRKGKAEGRQSGKWVKYASARNRGVRHGTEFVQESSEYSLGQGGLGTAVVYSNENASIFKFKERASCIDEGIIRVGLILQL